MGEVLSNAIGAGRISDNTCPVNRSISSVLSLLGDSGREATKFYLRELGLTAVRIPHEPEEFRIALKSIFGSGAEVLLRLIISDIEAEASSTPGKPACALCDAWMSLMAQGSSSGRSSGQATVMTPQLRKPKP